MHERSSDGAVFFPEEPRFWKSPSLRFPMKGRSPGDLFNNAVSLTGTSLDVFRVSGETVSGEFPVRAVRKGNGSGLITIFPQEAFQPGRPEKGGVPVLAGFS